MSSYVTTFLWAHFADRHVKLKGKFDKGRPNWGHFDVKLQRSGVAKLGFWLIYAYEDTGKLLIVSSDFGENSNIKK